MPTLADSVAALAAQALAIAATLGLAGRATLARDVNGSPVTADADAVADDGAAGLPPGVRAVALLTVRVRRLIVSALATDGTPLPFDPSPGDTVTFGGVTAAVLDATPLRPGGAVAVAFLVDLEG